MSNNPTLIAGFEDFLSYIRNQDAIIKTLRDQQEQHQKADAELEELNKELIAQKDAEIAKLKKQVSQETTTDEIKEIYRKSMDLHEENKKLKEECYKRGHCEEVVEAHTKGILKRNKEIKELKEQIEELKDKLKKVIEDARAVELYQQCMEDFNNNSQDTPHKEFVDEWCDDVCISDEEKQDLYNSFDIDYEEESSDKYDGDDWGWVYGKMIVDMEDGDKEVVLCMGGGVHLWENYIMSPTMNYIENKSGKHPQHGKVLVQSSCGKYVSFQDKDYNCEEDEIICEYENVPRM